MRYILLFLFIATQTLVAQNILKGKVIDENNQPVIAASIYWENTQDGVSSDENGDFELPLNPSSKNLVISYIGYKQQVLPIASTFIKIKLVPDNTLGEVVVTSTKRGMVKSQKTTANTVVMSSAELLKAACCNLSESFQTGC